MDSTTEATNSVQQASINNKRPKNRKNRAVATAAVSVSSKKYNLRIKSTTIRTNESQLYRNSTNANHHQNNSNKNDSPLRGTKLLKHKPPPLSKYRRRTANLRERCRMQEINDAFKKLQSVVPDLFSIADSENNHPNHHHLNNNCSNQSIAKLTKINTLKLAVNYISALTQILKQSDDSNNNNGTDMNKSKPSSLDINTNRCSSEFHFGLEPQSHQTSSVSKNVEFSSSSSSSLSSPPPPPPPSSSSSSSSFLIQTTHIDSYPNNKNNPPSIDFQNIIPNTPIPTTITTLSEDYFQDVHLVNHHHHHHPHLLASSSSVSSSFSNHNADKFKITTNINENNDDDLANNIDTIFDDLDCLLFEDYGS